MSNREKIIVLLMVAAVGYAVFALFINPASKTQVAAPQQSLEEYRTLAQTVSASVAADDPAAAKAAYAVIRAGEAWPGDPFLSSAIPVDFGLAEAPTGPAVSPLDTGLSYTGYIKVGNSYLAVINGREYEVGETVVSNAAVAATAAERSGSGGFVIRDITDKQVVIAPAGEGGEIILLLEDFYEDFS
jgi:hypothetical protein